MGFDRVRQLVGLVAFKMNMSLSRFVTEQMSIVSGLPVFRQQKSRVDEPYALASRLGFAVVQEIIRRYEAGATASMLAERLGVTRTGLLNLLHSQGAAVRSPRGLSAGCEHG